MAGASNNGIRTGLQDANDLYLVLLLRQVGRKTNGDGDYVHPLRKKIENSDRLAGILGWMLTGYLRLCFRTGTWVGEGESALADLLKDGPVTLICWHGRLVMAPVVWKGRAPAAVPRDPSPAGRLSAATQERLGTQSFAVDQKGGNFGVVRQILRLVRSGVTLGLTADGPIGPDRIAKPAAVDWARAAGRPVVLFAWSQRRAKRMGTWDKMLFPVPFGGGAWVYRRWDVELPKQPDTAQMAALCDGLASALDGVANRADELAGRSG